MDTEFRPSVAQYALTHVDGEPLPTANPAYGTPLIAAGRLAFLPRDLYRWLPDSDGSVFLGLEDATGASLGGLAGDYLDVAPGLVTFPVPLDPRRSPQWKASVDGDRVLVERRFPDDPARGAEWTRWYWSRIRRLEFVRVPVPLRWPRVGFVEPWWQAQRDGDEGEA